MCYNNRNRPSGLSKSLPIVISAPNDVAARLSAMGLSVEVFHDALLQGDLARSMCGPFHPRASARTAFWSETTAGLRTALAARNWQSEDPENLAIIVSRDDEMAIVVATGDNSTAKIVGDPRTRSKRGPATQTAVRANQIQLELLEDVTPIIPEAESASWILWILLIRRDEGGIHAELSLPEGFDVDGHIVEWHERIILPSIRNDGDGTPARVPEPGPEFDIDVVRRGVSTK